jgi:ADP-ribose pyrophosphatase YjhB (NUDIX family)
VGPAWSARAPPPTAPRLSGYLSAADLESARAAVPIVCVDLVPVRESATGHVEVGLVLREMPGREEPVWCHLGGRIHRGETLRAALLRHLTETLHGVELDLPPDPQPASVVQYFPTTASVEPGLDAGYDPRQHAVALVFAVSPTGEPTAVPGGEGIEFRWWDPRDLESVADVWPGTVQTVRGALRS